MKSILLVIPIFLGAGLAIASGDTPCLEQSFAKILKHNEKLQKELFEEQSANKTKAIFLEWQQNARDWLQIINKNPAPAYYAKDDAQTFSTIQKYLNQNSSASDHESSKNAIRSWVQKYEDYPQRLQALLDEGFTAKAQAQSLKGLRLKTRSQYPISVELPFMKEGKITSKKVVYNTPKDLILDYNKASKTGDDILGWNDIGRFVFRNTLLDQLQFEQAQHEQRIALLEQEIEYKIRHHLESGNKDSLPQDEQNLLTRIRKTKESPSLGYQSIRLAAKEIVAEAQHTAYISRAELSRINPNSVLENSITTQNKTMMEKLSASVQQNIWPIISLSGAGSLGIYVKNSVAKTTQEISGINFQEKECASKGTEIEFEQCVVQKLIPITFVDEIRKQNTNPNYNIWEDPAALKKRDEYIEHLVEMRQKYGKGSVNKFWLTGLQKTNISIAKNKMLNILKQKNFSTSIQEKTIEFFEAATDNKKRVLLLGQIRARSNGLGHVLDYYIANEQSILEYLQDTQKFPETFESIIKKSL